MVEKIRQLATERGLQLAVVWMEDPLRIPVPTAAFDCVLGLAQLLANTPAAVEWLCLRKCAGFW